MNLYSQWIDQLSNREDLSASQMEEAINLILQGSLSTEEIAQFLILLRDKKESPEEIKGAVLALRKKMQPLPCKTKRVIDTCGTGGDKKNTFNISTAVAFVAAGAGVAVAKHGNRAVSSKSGSADVLKACGVCVDAPAEVVARCVDEIGIGFLFAPCFHQTLKSVAAARQQIGTKTVFNILGPLLNPAGARCQVIGVYDPRLLPVVASVLKDLGSETVAVVHGGDGMDELTMTTTSEVCWLRDGKIHHETFDPRTVGYAFCGSEDLVGGDAAFNAKRLKKMLKGHSQPVDHCVHLNAALAIMVSGKTNEFKEALLMAQESISSGRAYSKLEQLIELTNENHSG